MEINEKIIKRRKALKLTMEDIVNNTNINFNSYWDIEAYEDEILTVTDLCELKKLCGVLKISDILSFFEFKCDFCMEKKEYSKDYCLPRNQLIIKKRNNKNMTTEELADYLGFEEVAIFEMEKDDNFLETWPIDLIIDLSKALEIPLQILLNVKCSKCEK